jgi:hypothetical protein
MTDFDHIPGQLDQWSHAVSAWFRSAIDAQEEALTITEGGVEKTQECQYFDQVDSKWPAGPYLDQDIVWNAFPGNQFHRWGRAYALIAADHVLPLNQYWEYPRELWQRDGHSLYYRPQDEYCEWRVERDSDGRIVRVTFTSEPPEYWQALHGDSLDAEGGDRSLKFHGDPWLLLDLYRTYVSEEVQLEDLRCQHDIYFNGATPVYRKGEYNPYNRWNTTDGIMHLTHPSNTLGAEIRLGADATVLWHHPGDQRIESNPDAIIALGQLGGNNRCSDPTIAGSVNQLAALGFGITLADPVGLYMDHLDMTGWTIRVGGRDEPVDPDWFQVQRGTAKLIERAVFAVPTDVGTVSDIMIGGEPIRYGGQLAERMTVKLVGRAALGAGHTNCPAQFACHAYVRPSNPAMVLTAATDQSEYPPGILPVFDYRPAISSSRTAAPPGSESDTAPTASRPIRNRRVGGRAL